MSSQNEDEDKEENRKRGTEESVRTITRTIISYSNYHRYLRRDQEFDALDRHPTGQFIICNF